MSTHQIRDLEVIIRNAMITMDDQVIHEDDITIKIDVWCDVTPTDAEGDFELADCVIESATIQVPGPAPDTDRHVPVNLELLEFPINKKRIEAAIAREVDSRSDQWAEEFAATKQDRAEAACLDKVDDRIKELREAM
jgi:hypothetical protein